MNQEPVSAWKIEELRTELDRYEDELRATGKPRNTITSYVYPVDRFLRWLEEPYRPVRRVITPAPRRTPEFGRDIVMAIADPPAAATSPRGRGSRYDGLREYLSARTEPQIRLTFAQIERIIGQPLPQSARRHRAWWANERSGSHVHARAWLEATPSRRTANLDLNAETADFLV